MRIVRFYLNLLKHSRVWLLRVGAWAGLWIVIGALTFLLRPDLLERFWQLLDEIFREILGQEELALNFGSSWLIFKNNLLAASLTMFLGLIFGLVPLLAVALNFFILGFLLAVFLAQGNVGLFFVSVLPHSVVEIPAFLIAAAFGLRFGLSFKDFKRNFKENLMLVPLIALLFFIAAILEIFVTGNLVELLVK